MAIRAVKQKFQVDVAVTRGGKTYRHRETVPTFADAQIREADVKLALLKGEAVKPIHAEAQFVPSEFRLRDCIEECYRSHWKPLRSGRGLYLQALVMAEFFGDDYDIRRLDFQEIEKYKAWLAAKKDNSPNTVNRKLAGTSKVLSWAQDTRKITDKPRIAYYKKTPGRTRWLSDAEEKTVLDFFTAASLHDYTDLVVILVDTGARPSEIFKQPRTEFDKVAKMFRFWDTKTNRPRSVPLTDRAFAAAERVWEKIRTKQITYRSLLTHWNGMKVSIGLRDDKEFTPYALRHTCCTRLIGGGADLVTVLKWMGHENLTTTQGYAHLIASNLNDAKKLLQRA